MAFALAICWRLTICSPKFAGYLCRRRVQIDNISTRARRRRLANWRRVWQTYRRSILCGFGPKLGSWKSEGWLDLVGKPFECLFAGCLRSDHRKQQIYLNVRPPKRLNVLTSEAARARARARAMSRKAAEIGRNSLKSDISLLSRRRV